MQVPPTTPDAWRRSGRTVPTVNATVRVGTPAGTTVGQATVGVEGLEDEDGGQWAPTSPPARNSTRIERMDVAILPPVRQSLGTASAPERRSIRCASGNQRFERGNARGRLPSRHGGAPVAPPLGCRRSSGQLAPQDRPIRPTRRDLAEAPITDCACRRSSIVACRVWLLPYPASWRALWAYPTFRSPCR